MAFRRTSDQSLPAGSHAERPAPPPPATAPLEPESRAMPITSMRVVLCRVFWMALGPVLLIFAALRISTTRDGWVAPSDLAYLVILTAIVGARWYCFTAGDPTDMAGNTNTASDLRRYTITAFIAGVIIWLTANFIGNRIVY